MSDIEARLADLENDVKAGAEILVSQGRLTPAILALRGNDVIILEISELLEKGDLFQIVVPRILSFLDAEGCILVTECFMTIGERECEKALAMGSVSSLPPDDRFDSVLVLTSKRGKLLKLSFAKIFNLPSGKKLGDWKSLSADLLSGRLVIENW